MGLCPYFHKERRTFPSHEVLSHHQASNIQIHRITWCTHKHSPVPSAREMGGANKLKCGGDFERCQVPPEKFEDQ